ncbi:hypothetical protein K1719_025821 [Acacia pycnantha]|nr:hypothetical protein K1719_025821 [Acacia pycnantha]
MLFKRFPAFWASRSYASVLDKTDVVAALFSVKMVRTDGQTTFHSHSDISEAMNYTFFSDVDDSKDTWSVVGKVLRKWVVRRKAAPYAVWKVGMLLADEKGSRIEVSATHKNLIDKLMDQPKEGIVYNF